MYHALVSADIVTDQPDDAAARLVTLFGLPAPRPGAVLEPPGHGFRAVWLRVQPSLAGAPTRIELIGARPRTEPHDYVEERIAAQGSRPVRTHATVLAGDVGAVLDRLRSKGVRHRVTPAGPDFDFPRVWLGVTPDDPLGYQPEVDAGLWLEVVPADRAGIPPAGRGPEPAGPGVRRVAARRFIVDDAGRAVRELAVNLGLEPASVRRHDGGTTVRYLLGHPGSAALELCEPGIASDLGMFRRDWGPGPHAIVLEVGDLAHMAGLLARHRVAAHHARHADGAPVLQLDPTATLGVPFELTEASN